MKIRLAQLTRTLVAALSTASLSSCQSGQIDEARLIQIGDTALALAERSGKITPEEAALAREAGKLLVTPTPATAPAVTTSTK